MTVVFFFLDDFVVIVDDVTFVVVDEATAVPAVVGGLVEVSGVEDVNGGLACETWCGRLIEVRAVAFTAGFPGWRECTIV